MISVWHRINLNVIGGVEHLFREFLYCASQTRDWRQGALTQGRIHPQIHDAIAAQTEVLVSRKYWGIWKIPRFLLALRRWHVQHALEALPPNILLSWSAFAQPDLVDISRRFGSSLLYYEHGSAWGEHEPGRARRFLGSTKGVIANSHAAKRVLQLRWGYEGPITVVHNGLREDVATKPARSRSAPRDRVRLGMVCRLEAIKGVPVALATVRNLLRDGLDVELKIAGQGRELRRLNEIAHRLGVAERISFLGTVEDVTGFYDEVDVLLAPSLRESFGMVSIEAQSRGCPVVVAAVDGLPETIVPGRTGQAVSPSLSLTDYRALGGDTARVPERMYDPATDTVQPPRAVDPELLSRAVLDIVCDAGRYTAMSEEARAWATQTFAIRAYAGQLISILDRYVLPAKRGRSA